MRLHHPRLVIEFSLGPILGYGVATVFTRMGQRAFKSPSEGLLPGVRSEGSLRQREIFRNFSMSDRHSYDWIPKNARSYAGQAGIIEKFSLDFQVF